MWPRAYFLDEDLQWLLLVQPDDESPKYNFVVARDGWVLLEAQFEISEGIPYEDFIQHFLLDLRTESFHRRFHEVARASVSPISTHLDCTGRCPWTCKREDLWSVCFEDWAWRIPADARAAGCRMFLHDDQMTSQAVRA